MHPTLTLPGGDAEYLSRIDTVWTVVFQAHSGAASDANEAQQELLSKYGDAILRYLRGAFRDDALAEETFQEFVVRLLRGDYRNAHPDRGRFRKFLKVVLSRLVADHYRGSIRRRELSLQHGDAIEHDGDQQTQEQIFQQTWRDEMLTRAWQRLADEERRTTKPWMTILRLRVENPELRSVELAALLAERIGQKVTATRQRVLLHRSREKFANYLIDAVEDSVGSQSIADVEQELADLELLQYCASILDRRKSRLQLNP